MDTIWGVERAQWDKIVQNKEHVRIMKDVLLEHLSANTNLNHQHFDITTDMSDAASEGREKLTQAARDVMQVREWFYFVVVGHWHCNGRRSLSTFSSLASFLFSQWDCAVADAAEDVREDCFQGEIVHPPGWEAVDGWQLP